MTVGFTSQRASNAKNFSIWWRHHENSITFRDTAPAHINVASQKCLYALFHRPIECLFTSLCGSQQRNQQSSESQGNCVIPIGNNKTWYYTQYCGKGVVALTASWYAYNLENNKAWDPVDPVSFKECADDMYLYANSLIIFIVVWDPLSCCSYAGTQLLTRISVNPAWISHCIHYKMWNKIDHSFTKL